MVSSSDAGSSDSLSRYRAKRSPDTTTEPFGSISSVPGRLFVVHKHAARNLHFDLRLEMEGVLRSWAVPRGPSYDTNDKRLAVHVEDHPLEYGDFEGVIPAGNYGAGGVIVWDRGEWIDLEDWRTGLEKGKLLFELRGHKLRGRWTLVKIKKSEREWLLIKERDEWVRSPGTDFPEESVLSGLTVEEVKEGRGPAVALRRALEEAKAPRARVDLTSVQPMQAEPADDPFTRDGWLFELKLDGYRLLAGKSHGEVTLLTRKGNDYTAVFPEIARAIRALPFDDIIIDGEVVVLDDRGMPSFARLQRRGRMSSPIEIRHAAVEYPATFYAFDLLAFEDFDVRPLPLATRKALLLEAMPKVGIVRGLDHIEREGERFLAQVRELGLEGLIAKKADAPYRGGRSDLWLKIKTEKTADFVIVGYTAPKRGRSGFGALQLADRVGGRLTYAGRAGTGFNDKLLGELRSTLDEMVRDTPPCEGPTIENGAEPLPASAIPETKTTTWVEPRLVCEVRYREWTPDGLLRHPAFLRMRDDKSPEDCERQGWLAQAGEPEDAPHSAIAMGTPRDEAGDAADDPGLVRERASADAVPGEPSGRVGTEVERTIAFSNLTKIYWPGEGYTKGDLIEYYRAIAPRLLPYLRDRPLVMTRFPDGIDGKSFYQKDAPEFAPSWIRTVPV